MCHVMSCHVTNVSCPPRRLKDSPSEVARLKAAGIKVAPLRFDLRGPAIEGDEGLGPPRMWPGGIAMSRTVGDMEAGLQALPMPHCKQVGRVGAWDGWGWGRGPGRVGGAK